MRYFIPTKGLLVPDPAVSGSSEQVAVPPEGKFVDDSVYWDRRVRTGDGAWGTPPAPEAQQAAKAEGKPAKG